MQKNHSSLIFWTVLGCTLFFIWQSSAALPDVVASHFDGSGHANGFMPRAFYVRFIMAFTIVMPILAAFVPAMSMTKPGARLNLPHKEYWLDEDRREETFMFLRQHMLRFGMMITLLLGYVHWLVIRANRADPPGLPASAFIGAIVIFVIATLVWVIALHWRFRKPS